MVKRISYSKARANFSNTLNTVYYTKEPVIVEKQGKAMAVLVSPDLFERLQTEDVDDWGTIEKVAARNADHDSASITAAVTAEVAAVRNQHQTDEGV